MSRKRIRPNPGTILLADVDAETRLAHSGATKYSVLVVDADGKHQTAVHCSSLEQCRQVVRVEADVYGPFSMFVIAVKGKPVETWAVSESGELKSKKHRS